MKINWIERHGIHSAYISEVGERLVVAHRGNAYMVSVFSDVQEETYADLDLAKQFAVDVARVKLKAALAKLGEEE